MSNMQEKGYRYVLRGDGRGGFDAKWVHPTDASPGDQDCTDMDDEAFDEALRVWGEHFGQKEA